MINFKFKNRKAAILLLALISSFLLSVELNAASYSGKLGTEVIYEQQKERWRDQSFLEIDYQHDLNFDFNYYLKGALTLESYYQAGDRKRELDFEFKEAYLNYYTDKIDWRLGRQNFSWGSSYNLNPLNYFNPVDRSELNPFEAREAVTGIKAAYYPSFDWQLTGVVTQHAEIEEQQVAAQLIRRRFSGYDLAFSVFSGNSLNSLSLPGRHYYPEVNKLGLDLKGDFSSKNIGLFSEIVFSDYQPQNLKNTREVVIGMDYKFNNNLYLIGQYYYQELPLLQKENNQLLMFKAEKPFASFHNWEINLITDLKEKMIVLRPKLVFSLREELNLEGGAVLRFDQAKESYLNNLSNELIYLSLSKYF